MDSTLMPQRSVSESAPASLAEVLHKMSDKDRSFNFDITLELTTRSLRVGTLRVHGKVEAIGAKRK